MSSSTRTREETEHLFPAGFERMSQRERRETLRDIKREAFRSALWNLVPEMTRAEIRELFEGEMQL